MHDHAHKHKVGGSHPHSSRESNIKIAIFLNATFTVIELVGGILTNSLAIISDALHDLGDTITLTSSFFLERAARKRKTDTKRTFGYQRLSLLSAIINAIVLIGSSLFILNETVMRFFTPEHVNSQGMIILAVIGIAFNALGSWRMSRGASANEKMLTWHLVEDVLGWVVILIGAIIMQFWDNHYIDPIMTIAFSIFILWGVVKNSREVFNIFMQGIPSHINRDEVLESLKSVDGVTGVHDLHIWSLEGETDVLTAHIVVKDESFKDSDSIRKKIKEELNHLHIEHSTLEIERASYCSGIDCE